MNERLKDAWHTIATVIRVLVFVLVIFVGVGLILSTYQAAGIQTFVVQTGSMEPTIPVGSFLVTKTYDAYGDGDVITFISEDYGSTPITHRIVEVSEQAGARVYATKGDANEDADQDIVIQSAVIGRVIAHVPYLGRPILYAQTEEGFILLVIVPAVALILSELNVISREVKQFIARRRGQDPIQKEEA